MLSSGAQQSARRLEVLVLADTPTQSRIAELLVVVARRVTPVGDLRGLMAHLWQQQPDVIIVAALPAVSDPGQLSASIRRFLQTPILVIGEGCTEVERIRWLDEGADDVLDLARAATGELSARCLALLRRLQRQRRRNAAALRLHAFGMELDVASRRLYIPGEAPLDLSPTQLSLLALLFSSDGAVVPSEDLAQHVWGSSSPDAQRRVTSLIQNLNRRFARLAYRPQLEPVRAYGYRLSWSRASKTGSTTPEGQDLTP
jgi:DNA-binding response OmpR family regulator